MSYFDFALFLDKHLDEYFLCLFFSVILYGIIFYKKIFSIFDPFTLSVFGSMMGFSVVLFLKKTDVINDYYFYQYIFSQISLWAGFFIFNTKPIRISNFNTNPSIPLIVTNKYLYIYIIISAIYILSTIVRYFVSGIPIFQSSGLNAVGIGGGFGIILRMMDIFRPICLYFSFYFIFADNKNYKYIFFSYLILILYFVFASLSGSRSFFLGIIQMLFLFFVINKEYFGNAIKKISKYQVYIFCLPILAAIFVIIIHSSANIQSSINAILFRIVSYGDTYYMAYPDSIVEELSGANIFVVLFGDFFRTLRLFPSELTLPALGFELSSMVNNTDIMSGPNSRHNIYGYVNFGFIGSILFSFFCGLLINIIRKAIFNVQFVTQDKKILLLLIYLCAVKIEADPPAAIAYFDNIILLFPIFLILNAALTQINKKTIMYTHNG
jgi:oligosaccharide repeat unit polymerase